MKVGIVGGTFNPIHVGHLMLGEYAYEACGLNEIWFMPNGKPPHKEAEEIITSADRRVEMTEMAIKDTDYFKLSIYEYEKVNTSYSYKTMEELIALYPENEFFFIMGSDSLLAIEDWKCPEKLMKLCTLLVACRENSDIDLLRKQILYLESKYMCNIILLPMPLLEISSSDIRKRVNEGKSIKYIVPEIIYEYIQKNKLYLD